MDNMMAPVPVSPSPATQPAPPQSVAQVAMGTKTNPGFDQGFADKIAAQQRTPPSANDTPQNWDITQMLGGPNDANARHMIEAMQATGRDPVTGQATALNQAVLQKGYTWRGNGDIYDPTTGQSVGNAFDLGQAGVDALGNGGRGPIAWSTEDAMGPGEPATAAPTSGGAVVTPGKVQTTNVPSPATGGAAGPSGALPGMAPAPSGTGMPAGFPTSGPTTAPSLTPTDPNNPLTSQTIDYGPLADRFKLAQSELENWNKTSDPQFQADLRAAMRKAAAGGALGSGMLQTSLGDIALNREGQRQGMGTTFLNNALTGTIGDAKDRAALAERQQGFQAGQQNTAFGQAVTEAELQDRLTGNQFQRELQKLIAGSSGNPADTQLALSGIFGNAGADASNALASLIAGKTANSGASSSNAFLDLLKQYLGGGSAPTLNTNIPDTLPTGQAIGGGTGPTSPFAVGY